MKLATRTKKHNGNPIWQINAKEAATLRGLLKRSVPATDEAAFVRNRFIEFLSSEDEMDGNIFYRD